jgi:SMODS and SLOG-associating 2TM effector domain 1/SMODS and SLOG-associating 2TM effector domain 3
VIGSISFSDVDHKRTAQIIAALIFFAAMGTTILLATRRWERIWYAGRAVAESAKSLTWKFVCGAEPFPLNLEPKEAVARFTDALQELLKENKQLAIVLCRPGSAGEQVTAFMSGLRQSATEVRRDVYLSQRVNEQQVWYARKSAANRKHRNIWFTLLIIFQAAAAAAAVILAINPTFTWKATAVFSTLASATVAWGQMKRYQELAQAYGLAAQELSLIAARGPFIGTSEELARFVNDAETAISREHAMWVARRETK